MPEPWPALLDRLARCRACHDHGLLHPVAKPLFCKFRGHRSDLLFVLEAPNLDDTVDPDKGYLTYDQDTDPSGVFFRELYTTVLGESIDELAVTNAVLCLPAGGGGRFPVTGNVMRACSAHLRDQILSLDPLVVVTVGGKALTAVKLIEPHGHRGLASAVGRAMPWLGRVLFPVYHTGLLARNGPSGRKAEQQREDWARLREVVAELQRGDGAWLLLHSEENAFEDHEISSQYSSLEDAARTDSTAPPINGLSSPTKAPSTNGATPSLTTLGASPGVAKK